MMPAGVERRYTVEDYFSVEESSSIKHEFCAGQIFAKAGASLRHNRITGNVFAALRAGLAGSACEVFASDLRVRTPSGLYTYPDVMAACGGVQLSPDDRLDTVINPVVLIEVLSDSTAAYDRGERSRHHRSFETLREYMLIDQAAMRVEHCSVQDDVKGRAWHWQEYASADDVAVLWSLRVSLALADIYAGVPFD